ncbi:alpha/beta hydrolase [Sphaerotilus sp.]|uniref:alpha/beta hydrolase n=1 Tax=Sphaerotilus sp. TaxID=2093942 RepID=UPI0034E2C953
MQPGVIVFSHGNSFPAGTYARLFAHWRAAGWRVEAVEKYGHDPRYPVTSNWPRLRDQLIDFVDGLALGTPVVFVGHSLGGFLSLKAALKRPDLAQAVVLLDSPVLTGWKAHSVQVAKATRLIQRISPGKVAARRRYHWGSVDEARAHFAAKHLFARWDTHCLEDYLHAGLEPAPQGGVQLAFDRQVEARIYNTLVHNLGDVLRRHPPRCPVAFIGGTQSREVHQVGLAATRALVRAHVEWIEGTHLFALEKPTESAEQVLALIRNMTAP